MREKKKKKKNGKTFDAFIILQIVKAVPIMLKGVLFF